jgi:hypothetical protein
MLVHSFLFIVEYLNRKSTFIFFFSYEKITCESVGALGSL